MQKAARWPCGVCGRGVGNNSVQSTSCQKWVYKKFSGIKSSCISLKHCNQYKITRRKPVCQKPAWFVQLLSIYDRILVKWHDRLIDELPCQIIPYNQLSSVQLSNVGRLWHVFDNVSVSALHPTHDNPLDLDLVNLLLFLMSELLFICSLRKMYFTVQIVTKLNIVMKFAAGLSPPLYNYKLIWQNLLQIWIYRLMLSHARTHARIINAGNIKLVAHDLQTTFLSVTLSLSKKRQMLSSSISAASISRKQTHLQSQRFISHILCILWTHTAQQCMLAYSV